MKTAAITVKTAASAILGSFLLLAGVGCESGSPGQNSDPGLAAIAAEEGAKLAAIFGIEPPDMDEIDIEWGARSQYNNTDNYYRILIREDIADNEDWLRAHIRHEMFHAMTGLRDGDEETFNGVLIASVVAWEA